ncbi:MAG: hypothetical protein IMX02_13170 [Limnochordaceae bacterium]|nr:hypothetical protein [Limnochordaceae bacterium]
MWVATVRARRLVVGLLVVLGVAAVGRYVFRRHPPARATPDPKGEIVALVNRLLDERAQALIRFDDGALAPHYDRSSVYGQWALEHEQRRLRYLRAWAEKRQIDLVSASSGVRVTNVRLGKDEAWVSLLQSTRLGYVYRGDPTLEKHLFGIGTRHAMQLVEQGGRWVIRRDWYTDPLDEDSLVPEVTPADVAASGGFLEPLARAQALGVPPVRRPETTSSRRSACWSRCVPRANRLPPSWPGRGSW